MDESDYFRLRFESSPKSLACLICLHLAVYEGVDVSSSPKITLVLFAILLNGVPSVLLSSGGMLWVLQKADLKEERITWI